MIGSFPSVAACRCRKLPEGTNTRAAWRQSTAGDAQVGYDVSVSHRPRPRGSRQTPTLSAPGSIVQLLPRASLPPFSCLLLLFVGLGLALLDSSSGTGFGCFPLSATLL